MKVKVFDIQQSMFTVPAKIDKDGCIVNTGDYGGIGRILVDTCDGKEKRNE